ncbi:uncharacterized protein LOC124316430 [Daphnia pulicaria]|uniref:uncharacterized protein LOC124316430 n=1 Tax=Daphnia pulicaria TaxID=35523 RepID=UPI001EECE546|nr:uncharacterized protein LOC124316430 [Daphnia pulicaria]
MAHFSVASLTQVVLLLIFICWTPSSTGAAFSLEEEFLQLKIQMKQVVKSFEAKDEQLKSLENKVEQLKSLESTAIELQAKVTVLEAKVEQQDSLLTSLLREKNECTAEATDSIPISNYPSAVAIPGIPSSCADLREIGHIWSGIFSVMGSAKMESVYCNFTLLTDDAGFQKWIGYVDVKSAPVYFYVQRNSNFGTENIPIPFDLALVNEGNAMDLTSGIFTAPAQGIYFFSFAGVARLYASSYAELTADLYLNGNLIGGILVRDTVGSADPLSPLSFQSTLNLKTGDRVWVQMNSGGTPSFLSDYTSYHHTHFTGFMLEEEIVASL